MRKRTTNRLTSNLPCIPKQSCDNTMHNEDLDGCEDDEIQMRTTTTRLLLRRPLQPRPCIDRNGVDVDDESDYDDYYNE